ncbi:extensin family protein [Xanthobacter sp. DSM 24535]|uniref:extensin family protein n=1 Tax=Roseixanthobacter psychrophilus TaxID=3119917 RepID=UPI00372AF571
MPHRSRRPGERGRCAWVLFCALLLAVLEPGVASAATGSGLRPPASLPVSRPRIPLNKVPLPVPRPEVPDVATEEGDETAESSAGEQSAAPAAAAPLPQPAPAAINAAPLPRLANVPFPKAREPLPGEQEEEVEEEKPAPALIPPPPPSGTAARDGTPPSASSAEAIAPGTLPALCAALVEQQAMIAAPAPPVPVKEGCSLTQPVRVTAVRLVDGNLVTLSPAAILQCEMAAAVTQWVRDDLGPAVATLGTRMETFKVAASYDCRPRNRVKGAKMSEHGQGNAIDFGGFETADKRVIEVKNGGLPIALQERIKADACTKFSTVLGPGSDGYHEDHIHVDIAKRRLDIKLCRWTIKTPAPAVIAARDAGKSGVSTSYGTGTNPEANGQGTEGKAEGDVQPSEAVANATAGNQKRLSLPEPAPMPLKRPAIKAGTRAATEGGRLPGG